MADAVPVKANLWSWLSTLSPAVIAIATAFGASWYFKAPDKIPAADPPHTTVIAKTSPDLEVAMRDLRTGQQSLAVDLAALRALAAERFPAAQTPRRVPSKPTKGWLQ